MTVSNNSNNSNIDVFSSEFLDERHRELAFRVTPKRLAHIEGVAKTAKKLAKLYGVDPKKAYLAGLLHDWDKGYSDDEIRARIREVGIVDEIDPFIVDNMPEVLHGPTAAAALEEEFPEIPKDVIRAIRNHTTTSVDADDLEKILYIADAIEPTRKFELAPMLRDLVGEVSLNELFFEVYRFWTIALLKQGKVLHPDTMKIWNSIAPRRKHK